MNTKEMHTTGLNTAPGEQEDLLALEDAAEHLCVSKTTLYRMLDRGEIKGMKVGRQWRFRRSDLDTYLTRGPVAVALAAMPVEVIDREIAVFAEKLAQVGETLPDASDNELDPWEVRVLQLLLAIVKLARVQQASDIHLEMMRDETGQVGIVRFRIDGALHEVHRLPQRVYEALIMRARLMATGDVGSGGYLDASLHLLIDGKIEDIRISVMSTYLGEALTARLIAKSTLEQMSMDELGFHPDDLQQLHAWLAGMRGMILVAGPNGSGKSLLMYKMLQEIASPERKVVSIEDPVEHMIPWVMQAEINSKTRDYASALRAFMMHDIDALLVSQLRDLETMDIALHFGATGHLVTAPVHVMNAIETMTRVVEVFPPDHQESVISVMTNAVYGVIAIRLIRKLCPVCQQPITPPADLQGRIGALAAWSNYRIPADTQFYQAAGCPQCAQTGYHGRTGIYEVLAITPEFREAFMHRATREELFRLAHGMRTLAAEGIRKAAEGITTLDEIMPIVRQYEMTMPQETVV